MRAIRPKPFRSPGLAVLTVLATGMGIGSFSASVVAARAFVPELPVEDSDHLVRLVQFTPVGTEAKVVYLRGTIKRTAIVTLGNRESMIRGDGNGNDE